MFKKTGGKKDLQSEENGNSTLDEKNEKPKKERKSKKNVVPEKVVFSDWDSWFNNCKLLAEKLKKYEELMFSYYKKQSSKTPQGQAQLNHLYLSKHDTAFYKKHPSVPKWKFKRCMFNGFVGFLSVGFLGFLIKTLMTRDLVGFDIKLCIMTGLLSGFVAFLILCGIPYMLHTFGVKSITKKMAKIEKEIKPYMYVIPANYRNAQALSTFWELYSVHNVRDFQQALGACEDYLVKNKMNGAYMAELYDVPYDNKELAGSPRNGSTSKKDVEEEKLQDPNLPSDILSKTFTGVDNADLRLNELVGLQRVKDQVRQMKNRMSFYNMGDSLSGNHMVFLGPPGTGKTTVARIITKILYDAGYIKENKCIEIDGGYLKSQFVGQTSARTDAIVRYAMGGVLFIDEAYILMDESGNGGSAGSEATGVLLKAMEDNRDDLVVIMAGYEDNINRLLMSNEGFASRIKHKIYFENFTVDELVQIFRQQMKNTSIKEGASYKITKTGLEKMKKQFERELKLQSFGNARVVRNSWDKILDIHADNCIKNNVVDEKRFLITVEDIDDFIEFRKVEMQEDGRNFIAKRNIDSSVVSLSELKSKTLDGSDDPDADLEKLTGLQVVKDEIKQMKAQFEFYNGEMQSEGYHMTFLGPPGTGKTTVAKIMTGYLYKMGIIAQNTYLDINGDFLRGMYVGHTGKRTEAVIQYSQGMVLFIDEAYLLAGEPGDNNSFGQEALGVLLDAMEKYRKNFVVIFAGYDKEMQNLLDMNSGLRSRISLNFHFKSYSPKELGLMLKRIAMEQKFRIKKECFTILLPWFNDESKNPRFGNGRFIRQFFEILKKAHIMNYASGSYDEKYKFIITEKDCEDAISMYNKNKS